MGYEYDQVPRCSTSWWVQLNGRQIYEDGLAEIEKLEEQLKNEYELPPIDLMNDMSPLNSYFLQGSPGEQRLIQDLVNEQLKMYGEDVLYLPRKIIGENTVIRENTAKFDDSFRIEAYLMNYEGFQGASAELLTKFGVRNTDELTLVISKERYDDFVQPIIDQFPVGERKKAKDLMRET